MSSPKHYVVALGIVVASEVVFKCLTYIYKRFLDAGSKNDCNNRLSMMKENQRIFRRVVFFPDQGIVSGNLHRVQDMKSHDITMLVKEDFNSQLQCCTEEKLTVNTLSHHQKRILPPYELLPTKNCQEHDSCVRKKGNECDSSEWKLKRNCFMMPESISSLGHLQKSTSLIHIINIMESAKRSLMICIFVLTCKDLIEAIVRAKRRGVRVRLLLEKEMANCETAINILHEHRVLVRLSNPALMMHHKFAIVDAPEESFESLDCMSKDLNRNCGEYCELSHRYEISRDDNGNETSSCAQFRLSNIWRRYQIPKEDLELQSRCSTKPNPSKKTVSHPQDIFDGVLMTGSFNWTWSAVVNNNENVIITNDPCLITEYVHEFESLWKNVEVKGDICK